MSTEVLFSLDFYLENASSMELDDLYCSAEPLLSDDIWKKFELDFPELTDVEFDILDELDSVISAAHHHQSAGSLKKECEIRNHDCMWAGHCGSKEHPADEINKPPLLLPRIPVAGHGNCTSNKYNNAGYGNNIKQAFAPGVDKTPAAFKSSQQAVPAGRSLLINNKGATAAKSGNYGTSQQVVQSPESPPMSDDEETKAKPTTTLQLLKEAIAECDIDEDSDLCEYFEEEGCDDDDDLAEELQMAQRTSTAASTHFAKDNDHCYHKDKTAAMRTRSLGIETPSDSEEEIDVVSVNEKLTSRIVYSLPTNPSTQDRQKLQRTVATAISNKHINNAGGTGNSIKTLSPMRKLSVDQSPAKRKTTPESRGIKRAKRQQQRLMAAAGGSSPCKRRVGYGHSSDSEQEPSEKRSLHNNMERQRRIDLRNAFEDLRLLVPAVNQKERAAKVSILREAADYCDHLGAISADKVKQVEELRRQQERLRARVSQLRRSLAAKR